MSAQAKSLPKPREIELDFIRGVAILLVIDFHNPHPVLLYPFLKLGFIHFGWAGVDIFFVLSGFLVGGLLVKEWKLFGRIDARHFLIRRGFKIWPQYYVFLAFVLLSRHHTFRFLWGNILNIQNYTGGIAHTWTLAVEEHAYLLLAFVCAFLARRAARLRTLFILLAAACVVGVTLNFALSFRGIDANVHTETRVDGIFLGVLLAILYHFAPEVFRRLQTYRGLWLAILVAALLVFRFDPHAHWEYGPILSLFADASGVATLLLLYHHRTRPRPAFYRFIAFIGTYSYGIYLWHVSVIEPVASLARRLPPKPALVWQILATPIAGILLGIVSTKLVEFPALKLRERLFPRRVDSAVGTPAEFEQPVQATPATC